MRWTYRRVRAAAALAARVPERALHGERRRHRHDAQSRDRRAHPAGPPQGRDRRYTRRPSPATARSYMASEKGKVYVLKPTAASSPSSSTICRTTSTPRPRSWMAASTCGRGTRWTASGSSKSSSSECISRRASRVPDSVVKVTPQALTRALARPAADAHLSAAPPDRQRIFDNSKSNSRKSWQRHYFQSAELSRSWNGPCAHTAARL